jgi:DNA primase
MYKALQKINNFYQSLLYTEEAKPYLDYMYSRGFTDETLLLFNVGFSPDRIINYTDEKILTYTEQDRLVAANHLHKGKDLVFDMFRGRITFPYIDELGRVCGFGGRTLKSSEMKYKVSPESHFFQKRNHVYGLNVSRDSMYSSNITILCEGFTDVMAFNQHGNTNVVGCIGTAVTAQHLVHIMKYSKKILFCMDSDEAGQTAQKPAIELAQRLGFSVGVINLGPDKDPAEALLG